MRTKMVFALLIVMLLLAGCRVSVPATIEAPPPPLAATPEEMVLELIALDGTVTELSMSMVQALPAHTGWGGIISSTGRVTPPAEFKGVTLEELANQMGGLAPGIGLRVIAEDGYAMTFSYEQITNGNFTVYDPGTGEETTTTEPLHAVVAYQMDGQPLDARRDGQLRLVMLNSDTSQVVDGHWSVKFVRQVALHPLALDWLLEMEGAITEVIDRSTFEAGASPTCHQATWTDPDGQEWEGIPLWLLAGWVDDDNRHEGRAFNRELAAAGYEVELIAADGYTVKLDIARFAENDNILVAHLVNGSSLEEKYFPLRLVGDDLTRGEMVGQITRIVVHVPETPVAPPVTAPPTAAPCAEALSISGQVRNPQCFTLAALQAFNTETLTVEHPRRGEQTYTGIRMSLLFNLANPNAEAQTLVLTAADGFTAEVSWADVLVCADCLLEIDEEGKLNAVMPGFEGMAWAKELVSLELR